MGGAGREASVADVAQRDPAPVEHLFIARAMPAATGIICPSMLTGPMKPRSGVPKWMLSSRRARWARPLGHVLLEDLVRFAAHREDSHRDRAVSVGQCRPSLTVERVGAGDRGSLLTRAAV